MRTLIGLLRLLGVLLHLLRGMWTMALRFPGLEAAGRQRHIQAWSLGLLRCVGLQVQVLGRPRPGGALLIANHVSWLDIASLHAACPQARFVSKADVLRWPLLGWLIRGAGTLFIERERKRDALRMVHDMAQALQAGDTVAVFPEGTTGPGPQTLPFHGNLMQAAIAVGAPIQPAVLRYHAPGETFATAAAYIDEMTLLSSVWRILTARGLAVEVRFLDAHASSHADRRSLAAHLQQQVQDTLDQVGAPP